MVRFSKKENSMKLNKILTLAVLIVGIAALGLSDIKMVYVYNSPEMMGQPAETITMTTYVKGDMVRMEAEGKYTILFNAKDKSYVMLYPEKKEYARVTMEKVKPMVEMSNNMLGDVELVIKDAESEKKIGDWKTYAKLFSVKSNMFTIDTTIEFTKEFPVNETLNAFYTEMSKFQGGMSKFTEAIAEADGYPVKFDSVMNMSGQKMTFSSVTKELSEEKLSDELFKIPADYKEVPLNMNDFRYAFMQ